MMKPHESKVVAIVNLAAEPLSSNESKQTPYIIKCNGNHSFRIQVGSDHVTTSFKSEADATAYALKAAEGDLNVLIGRSAITVLHGGVSNGRLTTGYIVNDDGTCTIAQAYIMDSSSVKLLKSQTVNNEAVAKAAVAQITAYYD